MINYCGICKRELNASPARRDCGGDCLACMAVCGDQHAMKELRAVADFCTQCSIDIFGEDFGDMKGICKKGEMASVLCEGCGHVFVDHTGKCINGHCLKNHGTENG
jgi:hypothetical protein